MRLSVVVAAQEGGERLAQCLRALAGQLPPEEMEVLVVLACGGDDASQDTIEKLGTEFAQMRFLRRNAPVNVPLLWTAGIDAANGEIVALTIENCRPAADWGPRLLAAHCGDSDCVGGAIEPDPRGRLMDWAIYFCRYTAYMLPFRRQLRDDVAADNCSYKREALAAVRPLAENGFWEALIHEDMRKRGGRIMADPTPAVTWSGGISGWKFLRRRYDHGRYFAARRALDLSGSQRTIRAIAFPAVPLVLLNRMAGRVRARGRFRLKFAICVPLIACFLAAWAFGEGAGYLLGYSGEGPGE
jgi:glycosyltransferase involved in cell wall biosynthesis